jgi:hypothetical protein
MRRASVALAVSLALISISDQAKAGGEHQNYFNFTGADRKPWGVERQGNGFLLAQN